MARQGGNGVPGGRDPTRVLVRELRAHLLAWDPIGVDGLPDTEDEYDCLINPLLRHLQVGSSAEQITAWVRQELREHFGLTPQGQQEVDLGHTLVDWWTSNHRGEAS